jgi:hypothetical protein
MFYQPLALATPLSRKMPLHYPFLNTPHSAIVQDKRPLSEMASFDLSKEDFNETTTKSRGLEHLFGSFLGRGWGWG